MRPPYTKSFHSIQQQIALLQSRGLDVGPLATAEALLRQHGYYRLSGYWHPLRQTQTVLAAGKPTVVYQDDFRAGTTLAHAVALSEFDRDLRSHFMNAVERIELALRVQVALLLGPRHAQAHRDPSQFYARFTSQNHWGRVPHQDWIRRLDDLEERSKEPFAVHFRERYSGNFPVWVSIEVWDFGMLSTLISGMTVPDQFQLGGLYGLKRRQLFPSWLRAINHIRNVCAHHSRLWNRSPADQPVPPNSGEFGLLDHLAGDKFAQSRIYGVAAPMQFLLRQIDPAAATHWANCLKGHLAQSPAVPGVSVQDSGFPLGWEQLALWN